MINDALHEAGMALYLAHGFLESIELTQFFPTDVLDGDFDYPVCVKLTGLVLVLEPLACLGDHPSLKMNVSDEEQCAMDELVRLDELEVEESKKDQPDHLKESFMQGFGEIEVRKIHIRYQDPRKKTNIGLNIGMGKKHGSIKIFECKSNNGPKSFRSVDKRNKGVTKPLQDVVKQMYIPLPSIVINPCADMIGTEYNFELQPKQYQVVQIGSLMTCSLSLDSRNLGNDITIHNPSLQDDLVFSLSRDQIKVTINVFKELFPHEVTPDILIGASLLDMVQFTISQEQVQHFFIEKMLANKEISVPPKKNSSNTSEVNNKTIDEVCAFYIDLETRMIVDTKPIHSAQSFVLSSFPSDRLNRMDDAAADVKNVAMTKTNTQDLNTNKVKDGSQKNKKKELSRISNAAAAAVKNVAITTTGPVIGAIHKHRGKKETNINKDQDDNHKKKKKGFKAWTKKHIGGKFLPKSPTVENNNIQSSEVTTSTINTDENNHIVDNKNLTSKPLFTNNSSVDVSIVNTQSDVDNGAQVSDGDIKTKFCGMSCF
eukprot:CAMPEP_0194399630 /NCGR_PEP_ID=MMETSP0174-20130528/126763_1 /TAXON_ID=216777 /ORGANISM="Proboscia alata, Strain PI-D3" /LENGTH=541 /DNA_ID=CAMNT_0039196055 /DNA_START=2493 /DNA_END=4118 /DNA_ORIENTATION=+